jgi:ADP-L-glycero-D-manno-heptose 6-epimerase
MFTKQAEESGIVKVYKDSEKHARDFVHVRDLITGHKKFLNYRDQGVFNLGTGKSRNVLDIATEIAKKYRAKIEKVSMPKSLEHYYQTHTQADTTKLMKTLKQ